MSFKPIPSLSGDNASFVGDVLGTGDGNRITNDGIPYLISGDSPAETQNLDEVLAQGNTSSRDMQVETVTGFQFEATGEVGLYLSGPYSKIRSNGGITLQTDDTDTRAVFGDNYFYLKNKYSANDVFRMVGGNAIIGSNTTPLAKLDVRGDITGLGDFLGTGIGNRITNNGVPYLLSGDSPAENDTLQDVTTRGNSTSTSILSTGPHISGVTGLFSDKIGIGTNSPSYGLHLKTNPDIFFEGNIAQNDYLFDGGGENLTVFRDPDNTNRTYLTFDKDDQLYVGRQGSVDFIVNGASSLKTLIQTDASENDVFFPDGKYGFGFEGVEPSALVHVSGDSFFDGDVGIGTALASKELDVVGDIEVRNSYDAVNVGSKFNVATGNDSVAFGIDNLADGSNSLAIGKDNDSHGNRSIAIGVGNDANVNDGVVVGQLNTVNADAVVVGRSNDVGQGADISIGYGNWVSGTQAVGVGVNNTVSGNYAQIFGRNNEGQFASVIYGGANTSQSSNGILFGQNNDSSGDSQAFGKYNYVTGTESTAIGRDNVIDENYSLAAGWENKVYGPRSAAVGYRNVISGNYSSAFGYYTVVGTNNTTEIGHYSSSREREGAVRIHDNHLVAISMRSGTAPTASTANDGFESETSLASDMYTIQRNGSDYILYHNLGGSIESTTLGATEADTLQSVTTRGNETTTSIISTGPYISGVTGLFGDRLEVGGTGIIGDAQIGDVGHANNVAFAHKDNADFWSYALAQDTNGDTYVNYANGRALYFRKNNSTIGGFNYLSDFFVDTDTLYVDSSTDRVGIGTTSPSEKLDVQGNVKLTGNLNVGGYIHPNDENGNLRIYGGNDTTNDAQILLHGSSDSWGSLEFNYGYDATNSFLKISQGSNEHLRITNGGKVGIGTTNPEAHVHIYSGNSSQTATNVQGLFLENNGNSNQWYAFQIATAVGKSFSITNAGKVGIGTTSPDSKLSVTSTGTASEDLVYLKSSADNADEYLGVAFETAGGGNGPHAAIRVYNGPSSSDAYMSLLTTTNGGTLTQGLTQNHLGKVGIGTTNPDFKLEVVADNTGGVMAVRNAANARDTFRSENAAGTRTFNIGNDANGHGLVLVRGAGGTTTSQIAGNGDTFFDTDTLYIDHSANNVGIGTTSPSQKLDVQGTILVNNEIQLVDSNMRIFRSSNDLRLRTGGNDRVTINSTGKVGIGTTSPATPLHVTGEVRVDATEGVAARKIRSNYFSSVQNLDLVCGSGGSLILGDGTSRLTLASDDTATFAGDVTVSGGDITLDGTGTSTLTIGTSQGFGRGLTFLTTGSLPTISADNNLLIETSNSDTQIKLEGGGSTDNIQFVANEVEQVRITTAGLGIGTTAPTAPLDVVGAGKFTGQVTIPATPSASTDAASKGYVDAQVGSADTLQEVTDNGNTTTNSIGIGTTSPDKLLHLEKSSSTSGEELLRLENPNADGKLTKIGFKTSGLNQPQTQIFGGNDNSGQGGSGGNSGAGKFKVTISNPSGTHQEVIYAQNDSGTTNKFTSLSAGGSEIMRLRADGNVGIGITNPNDILQVKSSMSIIDSDGTDIHCQLSSNASEGVLRINNGANWGLIARGQSNNPYLGAYYGGSLNIVGFSSSDGASVHHTLTKFDFANQRVGIGTTNPDTKLHVVGSNYENFTVQSTSSGYAPASVICEAGNSNSRGAGIFMHNTVSDRIWYAGTMYGGNSAAWNLSYNSDASALGSGRTSIAQNSYSLFTVTNTGNVGIGTTSPAHKLTVSANNNTTAVGFDIGSNASFNFSANSTSGYTTIFHMDNTGLDIGHGSTSRSLNLKTGGADRLVIEGGGDVGIGTTNPASILHVEAATPTVTVKGTSTASSKVNLINGSVTWSLENQYVGGATTNMFRIFNSSLGADALTIHRANNNVGIGTTNPSAKLHVSSDSGGALSEVAHFVGGGSTDDKSQISVGGNTSSALVSFGFRNTGSGFGYIANASDTEIITIDGGNERVGIGTTSPSAKLEVNGHFAATSKSFIIDHPTKEDKKLQYASLEGPENGVYVRGTTDKETIELPEYWSELVHEDSITVVLTPIGKKQDLFIIEKSNKLIKIGGAEGSFDYVVYGERKDIDKLEIEPLKV